MSGFNQQTIIGNLSRDAELRYTPSGKPVAQFRVIANTGYGEHKHTEGFNIVAWGKLAETLTPYLTKGKQVLVQGETRTRKYQDRDGKDRFVTEIVVNAFNGNVTLLGGGNGSGGEGRPQSDNAPLVEDEGDFPETMGDEEVPF